jgi:hypothetical protein
MLLTNNVPEFLSSAGAGRKDCIGREIWRQGYSLPRNPARIYRKHGLCSYSSG